MEKIIGFICFTTNTDDQNYLYQQDDNDFFYYSDNKIKKNIRDILKGKEVVEKIKKAQIDQNHTLQYINGIFFKLK